MLSILIFVIDYEIHYYDMNFWLEIEMITDVGIWGAHTLFLVAIKTTNVIL